MQYTSTVTHESKSCEGVRFTVLKVSSKRRDQLMERMSKMQARAHEVQIELADISPKYDIKDIDGTPEEKAENRLRQIGEQYRVWFDAQSATTLAEVDRLESVLKQIDAQVAMAYTLWGVQSIEGLEIDGVQANVELAIEAGPEDLTAEMYAAVKEQIGLSQAERKNSQSPTTSGAVVGGETSATSATSASEQGTTSSEIVDGTSRSS